MAPELSTRRRPSLLSFGCDHPESPIPSDSPYICAVGFGRWNRISYAVIERYRAASKTGSAFPEPEYDEHDPGTERHAAHPAWDDALLLHFRLDITEL